MIQFIDTIHDFGVFEETKQPMSCRMHYTNVGDSALLIKRVQPTCGCTVGEYSRAPLAPGDTAFLTLTYTPLDRPGPFSRDVNVYTTGRVRKSVIAIQGRMIGTEASLSNYYEYRQGHYYLTKNVLPVGEMTRAVANNYANTTLYNGLNDSIILKVIDCPDHISMQFASERVPQAGATLVAAFYDNVIAPELGFNCDTVTLGAVHRADTTAVDTIRLTVTAIVHQDFSTLTKEQLATAPVALLSATMLQPGQTTFTISNSGTDPLEVKRIYNPDGRLTQADCSRRLLKQGEQATISVKAKPAPAGTGVYEIPVTVITNDPLHPEQIVTIKELSK